nr:hypothetical protein BN993_02869 [Virgibacillus halodenitrificans]
MGSPRRSVRRGKDDNERLAALGSLTKSGRPGGPSKTGDQWVGVYRIKEMRNGVGQLRVLHDAGGAERAEEPAWRPFCAGDMPTY